MKTSASLVLSCLLVLSTLLPSPLTGQERADLLLHNGPVITVDDMFSVHTAVAVRDGRIVAVGGEELVERFEADRVVDLQGRSLLPGFNDTHLHVSGHSRHHVDLAGSRSMEELKSRIRRKAEELGPGEWVSGRGWSEDELEEGRRPLRWDLDDAAPENPVIATRAGSHSSVANSLALERAGITPDTEPPPGGSFEVDDEGRLNGVLRERAQQVVRELLPRASDEELKESFIENLRGLLELGMTSFISAGVYPDQYAEWQEVYREHGEELPRAAVQIRIDRDEFVRATTPEEVRAVGRDVLERFGLKTGDGDERLRVGALKVSVDGGYTGAAAATLEPYRGQPDYYGVWFIPEDDELFYQLVREAHDLGWQMGYHTIGDAAIHRTVEIFDRVLRDSPRADHRHYLNHFTVLPPRETLRTMARRNILVAQQPNFVYTLEGRYVENLEGDRLELNNPVGILHDHGIFVALGNDVLPTDPRVALYGAVTRRGMSGRIFGPEDRVSLPEAIRGYTRNGAYLTWEEDLKGTIEPGKLADFVVLAEDILEIDPERLLELTVDMTVVDGRILYERPGARLSGGGDP